MDKVWKMSTTALYNDQGGGAETAVEAGQESTATAGAGFGFFSADFKK